MKAIAVSLLLMLLSGLAPANEKAPFKLQVVIDQNSIQEFLIDIDSYVSQEFVLTDELRLSVIVNPHNSKNLESNLYSNRKVIHSAVQAKDADSGPNFYLICSGKLAKFMSPLEGKVPSCPVPGA